jgi:hypothetical protein
MAIDYVDVLQQAIMHGGVDVFDTAPQALSLVLRNREWVGRGDRRGRPFESFEAFVTHIRWQGLETTIEELLHYCRK